MDISSGNLFNYNEFFEQTDTTHVSILEHAKVGVFEVIFYKPDLEIEVPRAYIDKPTVYAHINYKIEDSKFSFASCITDKSLANYASDRIRNNDCDQTESNHLEPHITEHHQLLM